MGVGTGLYIHGVFNTGDSSGFELCARILKSVAKAAWCLWRVSTLFTRSAITPPEVKRFGWKLWHTRSILLIAAGSGKGHIAIHLSNYIEPSVYSGDAPNVKLLSPLVIIGRPHRQSHRQPSPSSRVLYCVHSTQHSHLVYFGLKLFFVAVVNLCVLVAASLQKFPLLVAFYRESC